MFAKLESYLILSYSSELVFLIPKEERANVNIDD